MTGVAGLDLSFASDKSVDFLDGGFEDCRRLYQGDADVAFAMFAKAASGSEGDAGGFNKLDAEIDGVLGPGFRQLDPEILGGIRVWE